MTGMMRERPLQEPSELVIWSATTLLGALIGLAAAFMLWTQLHRTGEPTMLDGAVFSLGFGFGLMGLALPGLTRRLFLVVLGCTLLIGYFALGGAFSAIAG